MSGVLIKPVRAVELDSSALVSGQHSRMGHQSKPITEVPGIFKAAHGSLTEEENAGKRGQQEGERLAGQERSFTLYHV